MKFRSPGEDRWKESGRHTYADAEDACRDEDIKNRHPYDWEEDDLYLVLSDDRGESYWVVTRDTRPRYSARRATAREVSGWHAKWPETFAP